MAIRKKDLPYDGRSPIKKFEAAVAVNAVVTSSDPRLVVARRLTEDERAAKAEAEAATAFRVKSADILFKIRYPKPENYRRSLEESASLNRQVDSTRDPRQIDREVAAFTLLRSTLKDSLDSLGPAKSIENLDKLETAYHSLGDGASHEDRVQAVKAAVEAILQVQSQASTV